MALQIRRGTYAEIQTIIPQAGELIYATDTEQLFVGDGSTVGGISVTPSIGDLTVTNTEINGVPTTILSDNLSTGTIALLNVQSENQIAVTTTASVVTGPMFAGTVTLNTLKFSSDGIAITSRNQLLGYTGSIGYTGSLGAQGAQGPQGAQGNTGFTGSLGAQGAQGNTGFTGSLGAQGSLGYTGSLGAQGTQGVIGYTGSKGEAGAAGADGDRYHTSSTSTLTISNTGTLTLYTADLNLDYSQQQTILIAYNEANHMHGRVVTYNGATGELVVNLNNSEGSGSYSVWEINLDGAVGIRGYTGSQGAQGAQGTQGLIGYTGSQGDSGAQGAVGYTGSQGAQGAQGVAGYTGSQGNTGAIGYTGSQGEIGYTGSSGATISTADNLGVGQGALANLTGGTQNVAIGPNAGQDSTEFYNNTLVGYAAGQRLVANNNVAVGNLALNSGTNVEYNVILGHEAGKNLAGPAFGANTFVGNGAGVDILYSSGNIFIGNGAGNTITSATNNTIIGTITVANETTSTVIIAAGQTERIKVDDTGLSINGTPFSSADIANFTFTTDTITSDGNISLVANTDGDIFVELSTDAGNPSFAVKVDNNNKFLVHNTSATFVVNEVKFGTSGSTATIATPDSDLIVQPGGSKIFLNKNTQFTGFQETRVVAAYTATFAPDVSTATIWAMTLTGGVTFNGFTNPLAGQSATVVFTQDSGGNRTLTSTMKFVGGSKTLSTAGTSTDIVSVFYDGTTYWASLSKGYA